MSESSDWSPWLTARWDLVRATIRNVGWRNHVAREDMEDFTSRVIVRALAVKPSKFDGARMNLLKAIARRQALDDARRRYARPQTEPFADWDPPSPEDPFAELMALDQVRRLGDRDARAIIGHVVGLYDRELADEGMTLDSITQRRRRARGRMAA